MGYIKDCYDILKDLLTGRTLRKSHIQIYSIRRRIDWQAYLDSSRSRYWVCGTSLIPVANNIMDILVSKTIDDVRIVLPRHQKGYVSHLQLDLFNKIPDGPAETQADLACKTYQKIKHSFEQHSINVSNHLRQYSGIMYSNITLFDNDAFVSSYDTTGIGDNSFTLHVHGVDTEEYKKIKDDFVRMWDSLPNVGIIGTNAKPVGCSIIFKNNKNNILLAQRDDITTIPYPGKWDILGGHVEENENPLQCIQREMEEEIDINIGIPLLFNVYDMEDRIEYTYWQERELDLNKTVFDEGQQLKWFSKKDILNLPEDEIAFNFKQVLIEFLHTHL